MQSNISIEEFRNVFYNNKKLSLTFNEFYLKNSKNENISINNENRINVVADNERRRNTILTSVTTHIVSQDPNNLNQRTNQNITTSTYDLTTLSQNYYITFLINLNIDTISSGDFSRFAKDKFGDEYTYRKTDMNLLTSQNLIFINEDFIKVNLQNSQ